MMFDLMCNAGGARPIKVRLGYGTRSRAEYMLLTQCNKDQYEVIQQYEVVQQL